MSNFEQLAKNFDWQTGQFKDTKGRDEYAPVMDQVKGVGAGALAMAQGAVGLTALAGADMTPDTTNPLGRAYHGIGGMRDRMLESQSPAMQRARGNVMDAWQEGESFGSNVQSTLGAVTQNPYYLPGLAAEAVGSMLPIGKAASVLGRVAPKMSTAARSGAAEGTAIGGLVAGQVAADPDTTYTDTLIALPAGVAAAGLGYAGGRLAGRLDPDVFIADVFSRRAAAKALEKTGKAAAVNTTAGRGILPDSAGRLASGAVGLGVQGIEEGLQEGLETAATNIGRGLDPMQGVGQAFTIGAMAGGMLGGGLGVASGSRRLDVPKPVEPEATDASDAAPSASAEVRSAYETAAKFMAEKVAEGGKGRDADPVLAVELVTQIMAQMGDIKPGRAGMADFFKALNVKPGEWGETFGRLASMTQSSDAEVSGAARTLLQIATDLPPKQLPNLDSPKSLQATESAIKTLSSKASALQFRITKVGDGDKTKRAVWQAELADMQFRLQALSATKTVIQQGIDQNQAAAEQNRAARAKQRAEMNKVGQVQLSDPNQFDLDLQLDGQQIPVGGEAVIQTVEGGQNTGPAPLQQTLFGSVPDTGALDLKVSEIRNNPNQRLAFVAAVQQKLVESLSDGNLSWSRIMSLRNLSDKSIPQLAELLGVSPSKLKSATRAELDRSGTSVSGSAMAVMQRAVDNAYRKATLPHRAQIQGLLLAAQKNPKATPAELLAQVQGPLKSVPPKLRRLMEDVQKRRVPADDALATMFGGEVGPVKNTGRPPPSRTEAVVGEFAAVAELQQMLESGREAIREAEAQGLESIEARGQQVQAVAAAAMNVVQELQAMLAAPDMGQAQQELRSMMGVGLDAIAEAFTTGLASQEARAGQMDAVFSRVNDVAGNLLLVAEQQRGADAVVENFAQGIEALMGALDAELVNSQLDAQGLQSLVDSADSMVSDLQSTLDTGGPPSPKTDGSDGPRSSADPAPRARLSNEPTVPQMDGGLLEQTISQIIDGWQTVPEIVIIENMMSDLVPQRVRDALMAPESSGAPAAFFYDGKAYINKAMMGSEQDVALALYHEVVGHFGLRAVLGNKLNPELDRIWDARAEDVLVHADRYELDTNKVAQRREAVEEFLAAKAEQLHEQGLLTNIANMIRAWWADLTGQTLTDAQIIRDYIKPAEAFVAARNYAGLDADGSVRFKVTDDVGQPRQGDNIMAKSLSMGPIRRAMGAFGDAFVKAFDASTFTMTILRKMARTVPSAGNLLNAIQRADMLANDWQQRHNILGEKLHGLSRTQRKNVTDALVYYSDRPTSTMPAVLKSAKQFRMQNLEQDPSTWELVEGKFKESDLNIQPWRMNQLSAVEQDAMMKVFEAMAAVHNQRTKMQLENLKHFYELLSERTSDTVGLRQEYKDAVEAVIKLHNAYAKGAYVPQSRVGEFSFTAKSKRYLELEALANEGDKKAIRELKKLESDGDHYLTTRLANEREAIDLQNQYAADSRFADGSLGYARDAKNMASATLDTRQLSQLLLNYETQAKEGGGDQFAPLSQELRREMHRALIEQGSQDTEITSRMRKRNIAGVRPEQVLDNTMEHIRHFGYAFASASTAAQRADSIRKMRGEIFRLNDADQVRQAEMFNEVLNRIESQFDNAEGLVDRVARSTMGVSSVYFLLTNPSYYLLQLSQSWVLTAPQLSGEFGPKAWGELAKAFSDLKPLYTSIAKGRQEITFRDFGEGVQQMFTVLQSRNVLDVGMSHDFGSLGGGGVLVQKGMAKLYFAARSVEMINRSSAALAAYRLRMEQLTKGKALKSYTKEQQAKFQLEATNYAEIIAYKTHGDYSFKNAGQLFRGPVLRNIMQFKKIGFVVAELLYENVRDGWRAPRLTKAVADVFAAKENTLDISKELVQKMVTAKSWLTEAELADVRGKVKAYVDSGKASQELNPRQLDLLQQALDGELNPETHVTFEKALIQRKAFAYTLSTSAVLSGSLSVPLLTSIMALMAKMHGADEEGEELDASSRSTIMRVFGPDLGPVMLRGVIGGVVGADVSQRIGINFVEQMLGSVYNTRARDPQSLVSEVATGLMGPSVSLVTDMAKSYNYFRQYQTSGSDHDLIKGFANASPLGIRNLLIGSLMDKQGLVNDSRMTLIPREDFTDGEIMRKKIGFNPARVSEFYDMRAHKDDIEFAVNEKRLLIKRSFFEATMDGDSARIERAMEQWRQLQDDQRSVGMTPSPVAELRQFVQRKRREQQSQVRGLQTSGRNRSMVERLVERYGVGIMED